MSIDTLCSTYTKKELASLLLSFTETGEIPPLPQEETSRPASTAGRPTVTAQLETWFALSNAVKSHYPLNTDLPTLAYESGCKRKTLRSLQNNAKFLTYLGQPYAGYFTGLSDLMRQRLTPIWRAIFDLHFYQLRRDNPGIQLPLYTVHALAWGLQPDKHLIATRNGQERKRLHSPEFVALLQQAGWPLLEAQDTEGTEGKPNWPCAECCPLLAAYTQDVRVDHIPAIRIILGQQDFQWYDTQQQFIQPSKSVTDIARQIIGVSNVT